MKSIKEYNNQKGSFYNSLQSIIEEPSYLGESLFIHRGKEIDSIFHKLNIYEYRQKNGSFIHESFANVDFTLNEQFAARDMLISISETYADSLCESFCAEYGIVYEGFSWENFKNGALNFFKNVKDTASDAVDQIKDGLATLKAKLKDLYEFVKDVTNNAIKSAKELVNRFLSMLEKIKMGFGDLIKKIGGDINETTEELQAALKDSFTNKSKRPKENIYESIGLALQNGERIDEKFLDIFRPKKKDDKAEDNKKKGDEYSDAQSGQGNENTTGKKKPGFIVGLIKQIIISTICLVVVPAIVGTIAGAISGGAAAGPAAMIAATIAKAAMSGHAAFQLIKNIKATCSGKEDGSESDWKQAKTWRKVVYVFTWICMFGLIAWGAKGFMQDVGKIITAIMDNTLKALVPDAAVQGCMGLFNNIWKAVSGSTQDANWYAHMMKVATDGIETVSVTQTIKPEGTIGQDIAQVNQQFQNTSFNSSMDVWTKWLLKIGIDPSNLKPGTLCNLVLDGSINAEHARELIAFLKAEGWAGEAGKALNIGLNNMDKLAGATFSLKDVPIELINKAMEQGIQVGHNGLFSIVTATSPAEIVKTVAKGVIDAVTGTFVPIVAMPSIVKDANLGKFRVRMGSARTGGYDLYTINGSDGIQTMKFGDVLSKFNDKNSPALESMKTLLNKRHQEMQDLVKQTNKKELKRKDRKKLEKLERRLDKMKEGVNDYECAVFFSEQVITSPVPESFNDEEMTLQESLQIAEKQEQQETQKIELRPIIVFNPLTMQCCDLVPQRAKKKESSKGKEKGPRKKPIPMKGLLSSYEFLPIEGGASLADINDFIIKLVVNSVNAAINISLDTPCIEAGKNKYEVNPNSKKTGERDDFGNFTNEEITEIMNDNNAVKKYMGGSYKKGSSTVEKENTESQRERKAKAKEEWKNEIENNEEIKKFIEESKTLKQLLDKDGKVKQEELDGLTDILLRLENGYGKESEKKGILDKFVGLFKKKEGNEKYDPKELQTLAFKLASAHNKNLRRRKKKIEQNKADESYAGEYAEICERIFMLEANMYILEEVADYLESNEIKNNNIFEGGNYEYYVSDFD